MILKHNDITFGGMCQKVCDIKKLFYEPMDFQIQTNTKI